MNDDFDDEEGEGATVLAFPAGGQSVARGNAADSSRDDGERVVDPAVAEQERTLAHTLEALLFVSPTPLSVDALAQAADVTSEAIQAMLVTMMRRYGDGVSGIVLERVAGGWAFRASDMAREALQRLFAPQANTRLSPASAETLAIVAYLQPIGRPDIARIRGVSVDAAIAGLLDRGLIEEAGRSDTGAVLFRTTVLFERAFGLTSIAALPPIEGFGPGDDEVARMREQLERMAEARVD